MTRQRYVTEFGMGTDVHGSDMTKAACRAVSDAIRHSSLNFFKALGRTPARYGNRCADWRPRPRGGGYE